MPIWKALSAFIGATRAPLTPDSAMEIHEEAARLALSQADSMGLPSSSVDATLMTIHVSEDAATATCYGDGVIVLQSRDGRRDVYSISYAAGFPLYPGYAHQAERLAAFRRAGGRNAKEVRHYHTSGDGQSFLLRETWASDLRVEIFTVPVEDYEFAAVLTDGVHTFYAARQTETTKEVEAIPLEAVLPGLLSFKTAHGAFVERRLKRFRSDCAQRGWRQLDDLSVGVVYLGG